MNKPIVWISILQKLVEEIIGNLIQSRSRKTRISLQTYLPLICYILDRCNECKHMPVDRKIHISRFTKKKKG